MAREKEREREREERLDAKDGLATQKFQILSPLYPFIPNSYQVVSKA